MYSYPLGTLSPLRTHHQLLLLPIEYLLSRRHTVPPPTTLQVTSTPQRLPSTQQSGHCHLLSTACKLYPQHLSTISTNTSQSSWDQSMTTLTLDTVSPYPNIYINHNTTATMKKSPLTPSTITPPSINRQHSYNSTSTAATRPSLSPFSLRSASTDARNILSQVASRAASPRRSNTTPSGSPLNTPAPESPTSTMERRRSWEDCVHQRDGYISFPDFDEINASASER
jgi:hypothetical protein